MRKGMERERKRRRLEAERREPNGVRSDPIFRKECGGEVIKKLNFIIRSERFFADCFSLTFGILPDGSEREWIGGRPGRKKSFRAGIGLFRFGALGAPKKRTVNGKLSAGSGRSKFFIVSSRGAGGFLGHAVDGRG